MAPNKKRKASVGEDSPGPSTTNRSIRQAPSSADTHEDLHQRLLPELSQTGQYTRSDLDYVVKIAEDIERRLATQDIKQAIEVHEEEISALKEKLAALNRVVDGGGNEKAPLVAQGSSSENLEPIEHKFLPNYRFIKLKGKGWRCEDKPPPSSIDVDAQHKGAWKCPGGHYWGNYYIAHECDTCEGCGISRERLGGSEEIQDWAWPMKSSEPACGFVLFRTQTSFNPGTTSSEYPEIDGKNHNHKAALLRLFMEKAGIEDTVARQHYSQPFQLNRKAALRFLHALYED